LKKKIGTVLMATVLTCNMSLAYTIGYHYHDYDMGNPYMSEDNKKLKQFGVCSESWCGDSINKTVHTYRGPAAEIEINHKVDNKVTEVDENKIYFEQGITLVKDGASVNVDGVKISGGDYNLIGYEYNYDGKKKLEENPGDDYGNSKWNDNLSYSLALDDKSLGNNESITVPEKLGKHTLKLTVTDEYPGETDTATTSFYVGPYPTIYYNATLQDSNTDKHIDTLSIDNIKMTCTYQPQSLTFQLYNKNGKIIEWDSVSGVLKSDKRIDNYGYNVTFSGFSKELWNLDPMDNYYLMVIVNDGRKGRTPDTVSAISPKYAKFGNPGF